MGGTVMQSPNQTNTDDQAVKDVLAAFGLLGGFIILLFFTAPLPATNLLTSISKMLDGKLSAKEALAVATVFYLTIPLTLSVLVACLWAEVQSRSNAPADGNAKW